LKKRKRNREGLLPHVRCSIETFLRLADLRTQNAVHEAAWDKLASGVILVDCNARVLWANQAARLLLTAGDGLSLKNGWLYAANPSENATLQQLLRTSLALSARSGAAFQVSRPSRTRPLGLVVTPLRIERSFMRGPAACVFIDDPERERETPRDLLKQLYGLTGREAELAALLMEGADLQEAGRRLGVGMNTARTHLRIVFEKTDTHRQAELVRLMLRGPAGIAGTFRKE
jgi:DNA-binding CsgD family transcriptional regulator